MLLRSFSLTGLRSDADFMLWRIGYELDAFEAMQDALIRLASASLHVCRSFGNN